MEGFPDYNRNNFLPLSFTPVRLGQWILLKPNNLLIIFFLFFSLREGFLPAIKDCEDLNEQDRAN